MYTNAQFAVGRARVRARPRSFYAAVLREFEVSPSEECFRITAGPKARPFRGTCALLEYLWPSVFGEAPVLHPLRTMSGRAFGAYYSEAFASSREPKDEL